MVIWIDISGAEFAFYKKDGGGWTKLANLRQPARDLRTGVISSGGSGGGGGGGIGEDPAELLQNTRTLPLINAGGFRKQAQARDLPPVPEAMESQEDANLYFLQCLQSNDVTVGDTIPRPPYVSGQLWFSSLETELTLYIYDGAVWVPAAPPVSLDGIEADINLLQETGDDLRKQILQQTVEAQKADAKILDLEEGQEELTGRVDALEAQDQDGGDYIEKTGSNTVEPDGGQWRIQGSNKTFIKCDTTTGEMGLFNLQAPSSDHHAVSRGWVKANTVAQSGTTKVSDDWKITSGSYSYFHIEEGKAKIYLQEPSHVDHR